MRGDGAQTQVRRKLFLVAICLPWNRRVGSIQAFSEQITSRYIESEIVREKMPIAEEDGMERSAPAPREMVELEANLKTIEENLREVNTNFKALRKNHLELSELKNMLTKTDGFLAENQFNQSFQENGGGGGGASDETTGLLDGETFETIQSIKIFWSPCFVLRPGPFSLCKRRNRPRHCFFAQVQHHCRSA